MEKILSNSINKKQNGLAQWRNVKSSTRLRGRRAKIKKIKARMNEMKFRGHCSSAYRPPPSQGRFYRKQWINYLKAIYNTLRGFILVSCGWFYRWTMCLNGVIRILDLFAHIWQSDHVLWYPEIYVYKMWNSSTSVITNISKLVQNEIRQRRKESRKESISKEVKWAWNKVVLKA